MREEMYCRVCNKYTEHYLHESPTITPTKDYYCIECGESVRPTRMSRSLLDRINKAKRK